ncbi:helix-turn-helix transcriptional regulator [Plantactinospora sp. B6F1]|uniref:helix-turn-helix domain-containing protein n=1 Tax=Plantactinospora sp. B6F1 TaxID=3158971 RepID=UPI00102BA8ED
MINQPSETASPTEDLAGGLRSLQDRSGKTLRELQSATFASDSALSRYLSGRIVPPWKVVAALCEQAGADQGELRPLWVRARAARRACRSSARPLRELSTVENHLGRISRVTADAISEARARGDQVPEHLLTVLRLSTDAANRLRVAQRLISSS